LFGDDREETQAKARAALEGALEGIEDDDTQTKARQSSKLSAGGREHQLWVTNVLGTLAKETPKVSKGKKKPGLGRLSTNSILRALGCASVVESRLGSASSPSIGADSLLGQQSVNSIRSQLTSPAESDWMVRQTWTPPSPPAPSSTRTERTDHSMQRVPSLPSMPATGLRLSPCSSATSQKALAANLARSVVPELDMTRVHMGFDDDEDTEDDPTGGGAGAVQGYASDPASDCTPSAEVRKADVPQLDMSAVQVNGAAASKLPRSSGSRNHQVPHDLLSVGASTMPLLAGDVRPLSRQSLSRGAPGSAGQGMLKAASTGDLRQLRPVSRPFNEGHYGFSVDVAGSVVAGPQKKLQYDRPVPVRLPPVSKNQKGKKPKTVSHVHMHHHLHYHVSRPAVESDLNGR